MNDVYDNVIIQKINYENMTFLFFINMLSRYARFIIKTFINVI